MKRWLSVALVMILFPVCAGAEEMPFEDVPIDHWAYDAVRDLAERGVLKGYFEDGKRFYKGEKPLSKYEFAVALENLVRALEEEMALASHKPGLKTPPLPPGLPREEGTSSLSATDLESLKLVIEDLKAESGAKLAQLDERTENMAKGIKRNKYFSIGSVILAAVALVVAVAD
ncbi:MAG: S-layer homology domain-containing protein [bacterium]